jgi:uncharacterized Zn-finger protein
MSLHLNAQKSPSEVLHVNSKKVSCDGGIGASSHPLVYLNMGEKDSIVCPYCSKSFLIEKNSGKKNFKSHSHD